MDGWCILLGIVLFRCFDSKSALKSVKEMAYACICLSGAVHGARYQPQPAIYLRQKHIFSWELFCWLSLSDWVDTNMRSFQNKDTTYSGDAECNKNDNRYLLLLPSNPPRFLSSSNKNNKQMWGGNWQLEFHTPNVHTASPSDTGVHCRWSEKAHLSHQLEVPPVIPSKCFYGWFNINLKWHCFSVHVPSRFRVYSIKWSD